MRVLTMMGIAKPQGRTQGPVRRGQSGFTIVETLIVLAVTGVLFLSAISVFGGKQNRTEFTQAINDIASLVNQTINEVASGNYPNVGTFDCQADPVSGKISFSGSGSGNEQGTNKGCIFIGKAIHFWDHPSNGNEDFYIYTLAGAQNSGGGVSTSLAEAEPQVVPNNVETDQLKFGITVDSVKTASGATIGSFAFVNSLGSYSGTDLATGSGQVGLLPLKGATALGNDNATEQTRIGQYFTSLTNQSPQPQDSTLVNAPNEGVKVCFNSGTTDQSGLITIGTNGRTLSTALKIFNGQGCTGS